MWLVTGGDAAAIAQVVLMLAVIWWMYDGYAWLTNAIDTDHVRHRLARELAVSCAARLWARALRPVGASRT